MSASPMTPAARREAVRLLLVDFENQEREARWVWKLRTENRSVQCLRHALGLLREERPDWFKLAKWMVGRTECQPMRVDLQREIDGMLSWLAQRMPADIAVPWECIEHWRRDVSGTAADDPPSLIAQLSAAYARETHLANADSPHDDDGWEPSYTDGRIAGRLPTDGHYQRSSRLQPVGLIEGTFASDEISATNGFEIQAARDCYVPTGRPRRGTSDPEQAAAAILEAAQLPTIEAYQAVLGVGRKSEANRATYEELARIVYEIRARPRATPEALAAALTCDPATVWRLAKLGAELIASDQIAA